MLAKDFANLPPMRRRSFLKASLLGAGAMAMPSFLSACGGSSSGYGPLVVDPNTPWWLQNGFEPIFTEATAFDLPVRGAIPPELNGLYTRNGSNPQNSDSPHWFLGDGMIHGVKIENGQAKWYRNRYVQTELYKQGVAFNQSIALGLPPGGPNGTSNVSTFYHGGRLMSSGEIGAGFEIDPQTLETIGLQTYGDRITNSLTAHPKIDPVTGHLHCFGYWFAPPYLTYYEIDTQGNVVHEAAIDVAEPSMFHSFAITDREAIFWECPVLFNLQNAVENPIDAFRWTPEYGTKIGILPFGAPGSDIRWVKLPEPCYVFHEVNAFRRGTEVVIDVHRLEEVFGSTDIAAGEDRITRWIVDTAGEDLTFREEIVNYNNWDLAAHDRRFTGRKYRHSWHTEFRDQPEGVQVGGIGYLDFDTGAEKLWDPGRGRHGSEPFFVPTGAAEGEGYLMAFVYDRGTGASVLAIFEAMDHTKGPVAEIEMPQRVPLGFHGVWVPDL